MFDIGMHWSLDDSITRPDPLILGMAAEIKLGKDEGTIWNRLPLYSERVDNFEFEIFDRSRTSLSGVIGDGVGAGWNNSATTNLPMTESAVNGITVGHVLLVEDEQVIVKSVDRSAFTIDVVARGHGETSAASHADTTAFKVIGIAINPTDLKNVESFAEMSGKYGNYCQRVVGIIEQEFDDEIQARKAFEQKPQLIKEAMDRIAKQCFATAILGTKSMKTKTSPYTTAGILEQLATTGSRARTPLRFDATGYSDPVKLLQDALKVVWAAGGKPKQIYISPTNRRKFNPLMEQFKVGTVGQKSGVVGTDVATSFFFEGEEHEFVSDKDFPDSRIEIVTEEMLAKGWRAQDQLRGPNKEPMDSTLESRWSIYGSMFLVAKGVGVDHIDLYNVAI